MMSKLEIIGNAIKKWDREKKVEFCEKLMLNLTIAIRSSWSSDSLPTDEKLDRIKWINEFHHRIINSHRGIKYRFEEDLNVYEIAKGYVKMNKNIGGELGLAIEDSFEKVNKKE